MTIEYGTKWRSLDPPTHTINVYMMYLYWGVSKYFCQSDETGRSKLLAEDFIKAHYEQIREKK